MRHLITSMIIIVFSFLAGSSNGDQFGRINSSHSIIEELARSDWMGLSGGDQSGRINTSHSIIEELARFGHFGSFFAILGHLWPFLGHFVSFLDKFAESSNFFAAPRICTYHPPLKEYDISACSRARV